MALQPRTKQDTAYQWLAVCWSYQGALAEWWYPRCNSRPPAPPDQPVHRVSLWSRSWEVADMPRSVHQNPEVVGREASLHQHAGPPPASWCRWRWLEYRGQIRQVYTERIPGPSQPSRWGQLEILGRVRGQTSLSHGDWLRLKINKIKMTDRWNQKWLKSSTKLKIIKLILFSIQFLTFPYTQTFWLPQELKVSWHKYQFVFEPWVGIFNHQLRWKCWFLFNNKMSYIQSN